MIDELIDKLREEIDIADQEILSALAKRVYATRKICRHKLENNLPIISEEREHQILETVAKFAKRNALPEAFITSVFREIIAQSRQMQNDMCVNSGKKH